MLPLQRSGCANVLSSQCERPPCCTSAAYKLRCSRCQPQKCCNSLPLLPRPCTLAETALNHCHECHLKWLCVRGFPFTAWPNGRCHSHDPSSAQLGEPGFTTHCTGRCALLSPTLVFLPCALGILALLCVSGCLGLPLTWHVLLPFNAQACAVGEAGCAGGAKLVQWYMSGLKQSGGSPQIIACVRCTRSAITWHGPLAKA